MPMPSPTCYLKIGDFVLDDVADVNTVTATFGRTSLTNQPSPSVFNATLTLHSQATPPDIQINDVIQWAIDDDYLPGLKTIFYGNVTDFNTSVTTWRNGAGIIEYSITGVGPLAKMNRYPVSKSFAKEYEGTRVKNVLIECNLGYSHVELPGGYEIAADTKTNVSGLELAQTAAQSGLGLLYENDDQIYYETYTTRAARTYAWSLENGEMLASGLGFTKSVTGISNVVTVNYGAGSTSVSNKYQDNNSATKYGAYYGNRSTELHNVTDANTQAQQLLKARAYPFAEVSSVVINLENPALTDVIRSSIIATRTGDRVYMFFNGELSGFDGFIEGYTWTLARNQRILTLNLSDYYQNVPYTVWYNVNAADTWQTYATATTKWSDVT